MAPSRHDGKVVDWDVKPQHNQPKSLYPLQKGVLGGILLSACPKFRDSVIPKFRPSVNI